MSSDLLASSAALPVIETPRLRLRPRRMADLEASIAMDREPGTTDLIDGPWDDPAAHRAFVRARIRGPYPRGLGYWVIARRERPQEFLGWVLLIPEDAIGPAVEIGWRVIGTARGQGFAPEAAANVLSHGFQTVGLRRVISEIHADNKASRRVAEKIGMCLAVPSIPDRPEQCLYEARIDCAV
ncbi:MAG: GNAT family N-acetyltransferase [Paracoccaceae bacterium]